MIAAGLAMASPYTRPNANPTGTPQAMPMIAGRFRLIPARRGQAMPDPLPIHLGDTHFPAAGAGMVSVTICHS